MTKQTRDLLIKHDTELLVKAIENRESLDYRVALIDRINELKAMKTED